MAKLKVKSEEVEALLSALGVDSLDDDYELKAGELTLLSVDQADADAAYKKLNKKAIAARVKRMEKERKLREKDRLDAKDDDDDSSSGIARRVTRLERLLNLK